MSASQADVWADPFDVRYQLARSAVESGNIDTLEEALDTGIDIHALYENVEVSQDPRPHQEHCFGRTLMHIAASKGFLSIVQLLLRRGADVERKDYKNFEQNPAPPIFTACRNGRLEVVRCLIQAGAQLNVDTGDTGCLDAAYLKPQGKEIVKLLLDSGADVDHCPGSGQTVLAAAIHAEDAAFILFLIERNASLDTALYTAAAYKVADSIFTLLLSHSARDSRALALATVCSQRRNSIVILLLDHHGIPSGRPLEFTLSLTISANNFFALDLLLQQGASLPPISLVAAAAHPTDHTDMIRHLIRKGIDVRAKIEPTAEANVDKEPSDDEHSYMDWRVPGSTALHATTEYAHSALLRLLLDAGAEADAVNLNGVTPLMLLCWFADPDRRAVLRDDRVRRVECLKLLLETGAEVGRRDNRGRTAADLLETNEELSEEIKNVLLRTLRGQ